MESSENINENITQSLILDPQSHDESLFPNRKFIAEMYVLINEGLVPELVKMVENGLHFNVR